MIKQYLEAGKITSTHGVRGEVRIEPWTNSPEFLCGFNILYIDGVPMKVLSMRPHKTSLITLFDGIGSIDSAVRLKNKVVFIDRNDASLEAGQPSTMRPAKSLAKYRRSSRFSRITSMSLRGSGKF
jgi:16S rRNA processing protein RimM